jgi:AcrR family transcriptional regulator
MKRKSVPALSAPHPPPAASGDDESPRPRHERDMTSAGLLGAARAIFVAEGAKALTVRRIADDAGCTTMAVYTRYGGKDGLLAALFDEGFHRLRDAQIAVDARLPPERYLVALCEAYRATAAQYPAHYALMLGGHSGEFTPTPESAARARDAFDFLVLAVLRWLASLSDPSSDITRATRVALQLFALSHGWASLSALGYASPTDRSRADFHDAVRALLAAPQR